MFMYMRIYVKMYIQCAVYVNLTHNYDLLCIICNIYVYYVSICINGKGQYKVLC